MMPRRLLAAALAVVFVTMASVPGCSRKIAESVAPQAAPTVSFDTPRLLDRTGTNTTYALSWHAVTDAGDAGVSIDHYLVALDPPSAADLSWSGWRSTKDTHQQVTIAASAAGTPSDRHRFVVIALDERGDASAPATMTLAADNLPPLVKIDCPIPSAYYTFLPPVFPISWSGTDPDGSVSTQPVAYKYILLNPYSTTPDGENAYQLGNSNPDSLRRLYEAADWKGWTTVPGDTTTARFSNLTPNLGYLFIVNAFDEQGASAAQFGFDSNMLRIQIGLPGIFGPVFRLTALSSTYQYASGGIDDTPRFRVEAPAAVATPVSWHADIAPNYCGSVRYRWVLDPVDLADETPRSDEATDLSHWSAWGTEQGASLGPFNAPAAPKRTSHRLFIEGDDGLNRSRVCMDLVVVPEQFTKDVLIVDDTRLKVDMAVGGVTQLPSGTWPTAAELDTFLYARGGGPWRAYPGNPTVPRGVFDGYSFDTLGTRGLGTVPLTTLGRYRHVIWILDGLSALNTRSMTSPNDPMTMLRFMGLVGKLNTLAEYVHQGGHVWMLGGGAGSAVSYGFNDPNNDRPTRTWSSITSARELGPGRFMWDLAKWQSTFRILRPETPRLRRALGRYEGDWDSGLNAQLPPKKYGTMPSSLDPKTTATDPLSVEAPTRVGTNPYPTGADIEFIDTDANIIVENGESTLDTLMRVAAATLPDPNEFVAGVWHNAAEHVAREPRYALMTYAFGSSLDGGTLMETGFPIWYVTRPQCTQLVDFVLHDVWGLVRGGPVAARGVAAHSSGVVYAKPATAVAAPSRAEFHPAPARRAASQRSR